MSITPKQLIAELGGYKEVAVRVGISPKTMHSHASAKRLPPKFYAALCEMAIEQKMTPPTVAIFEFVVLSSVRVGAA